MHNFPIMNITFCNYWKSEKFSNKNIVRVHFFCHKIQQDWNENIKLPILCTGISVIGKIKDLVSNYEI